MNLRLYYLQFVSILLALHEAFDLLDSIHYGLHSIIAIEMTAKKHNTDHIYTSYQATSDSVSSVKFFAKLQNLNFW